jgi:multidrug efflux pump subunit AcrA (membrane-fusion protein)
VAPPTRLADPNAQRIDQLWAPLERRVTQGAVWKWDEAKKELTQVRVTLGVSDGSFTELISGDLTVGDQVVTGVVLPASMRPTITPGNPLMGGQQQRGGGGGRGGR